MVVGGIVVGIQVIYDTSDVAKAVVGAIVVVVVVVVKHESCKGLFTPKILNTSEILVDKKYV